MLAGRLAQHRLETALAEHGLTVRHLGALGHLARDPGLSYSELARRARITVQSMYATIDRLMKLDAIDTVNEPTRGRRAQLCVTAHGHDLLAQAAETAAALDDDLLAALDPVQRRQLKAALLGFIVPPTPGNDS